MYTDPVAKLGEHLPMALTRGVWAGGQRHGIVLWSSDIESTFDELTAQVHYAHYRVSHALSAASH